MAIILSDAAYEAFENFGKKIIDAKTPQPAPVMTAASPAP